MISDDNEILPSQEIMIRIPRFDDTLIISRYFCFKTTLLLPSCKKLLVFLQSKRKKELTMRSCPKEKNKIKTRKDI